MTVDAAFEMVGHALDAGRPAHGYLIVGPVAGEATELAIRILRRLFCTADPAVRPCGTCDACRHVAERAHPDIVWLMPEKKTRIISVDAMETKLLEAMGRTSFLGGWKAGVIVGADRLNEASANAFLKTLEEPPPQTLFLLLTDEPERLLPTIVSRCQRVDLANGRHRGLEGSDRTRILDVLASERLGGVTEKAAAAALVGAFLDELHDRAADQVAAELEKETGGAGVETTKEERDALVESRYRELRADFLGTLVGWFRDLTAIKAAGTGMPLVNADRRELLRARAAHLTLAQCFNNVTAVEEFAASLGRNLREEALLPFLFDRLAFGTEAAS